MTEPLPDGVSAWEVHRRRQVDRAVARVEARRRARQDAMEREAAERKQIPFVRTVSPVERHLEALAKGKRSGLRGFLRW